MSDAGAVSTASAAGLALPRSVLLSLPPLFLLPLLLLVLYHALPLIHLLPRPGPLLSRLAALVPRPRIPHPLNLNRGKQHLPREFFNLPPRPDTPASPAPNSPARPATGTATGSGQEEDGGIDAPTLGAALGVRGKLVLLLCAHAGMGLIAGWMFLAVPLTVGTLAGNAVLGLTVLGLPVTVATMALYSALSRPAYVARHRLSTLRLKVFGSGGVTHETVLRRIAPVSVGVTLVGTGGAMGAGSAGGVVLLGLTMGLVGMTVVLAALGMVWRKKVEKRGMIRLASPSPSPSPSPASGLALREGTLHASSSMGFSEKRVYLSEDELRAIKDSDSWIESPSRPPTPISPFSYSPSLHNKHSGYTLAETARSRQNSDPSSSLYGTPISHLSEPTITPQTISSWNFSDVGGGGAGYESEFDSPPPLPSPSVARTRTRDARSTSVSRASDNNPMAGFPSPFTEVSTHRTDPRGSGTTMFTQTLTSTPGSALRAAGGSIIAAYSPELFNRMPRGFESLTSFPVSPEAERVARTNDMRSGGGPRAQTGASAFASAPTLAFVPEQHVEAGRGTSSYTLASYYSPARPVNSVGGAPARPSTAASALAPSLAYTTPKSQIRASQQSFRAPPPPPMPLGMPLPPTPTAGRSETLWDGTSQSECESDAQSVRTWEEDWEEVEDAEWVNVRGDGEELESWGRGGRGVGALAVLASAGCSALSAPVLLGGLGQTATILFLVSVLLPAPLIALASYLLRPRPLPYPTQPHNLKKGSTTSISTHKSLALASPSSGLSIPGTLSPKLTPPLRKRPSVPLKERWARLLESKPSIRQFGYAPRNGVPPKEAERASAAPSLSRSRSAQVDLRRQTLLGATLAAQVKDADAEAALRRNMNRRSTDLWLEAGHARPASTRFERVREMIKPSPALCMMEPASPASPASPAGVAARSATEDGVMGRLRDGVVSILPKRVSRVFGAGTDIEMGQWNVRESVEASHGEVERPFSPITIHITSPSKYDQTSTPSEARARQFDGESYSVHSSPSRSTDTHGMEEGEGDDSGAGAEMQTQIQTARRGRMSAGPMYIFAGQNGSPTSLAFSPMRSRFDLPRPASGQFDDAESPSKRQLSQGRTRSASVGPDMALGAAGLHLAQTENAPRDMTDERRTLRHKHSFSLPLTDKVSFSDLRRRLDKCGKRPGHLSIYADEAAFGVAGAAAAPKTAWPLVRDAEVAVAVGGGTDGHDLRAFPIDFTHPSFSPSGSSLATTHTREPRTPANSRARQQDQDSAQMSARTRTLAKLSLSAAALLSGESSGSGAFLPTPKLSLSATATEPSAGPTPYNPYRARTQDRLSADSALVGQDSILSHVSDVSQLSENETLAREMEHVLRMDSPTRAEFVISPQPSMASLAQSDRSRSSWACSAHAHPQASASARAGAGAGAGARANAGRLSRASSTGGLISGAASFGRASPFDPLAQFEPAPRDPTQNQHQQLRRHASAASVRSTRTVDSAHSFASGWTSMSGSTTYTADGDYSIIGTYEIDTAPPVPAVPAYLRRPLSMPLDTVSGVPLPQRMQEAPAPAPAPVVSRPFARTNPAATANKPVGIPTSIPLPPPSALPQLAPAGFGLGPGMGLRHAVSADSVAVSARAKRESAQLHPAIPVLQRIAAEQRLERERERGVGADDRGGGQGEVPEERGSGHTRGRKSVDTLHSATSCEAEIEDEGLDGADGNAEGGSRRTGCAGEFRPRPEWRLSKHELRRVLLLRERAAAGEEITRGVVSACEPDLEPESELGAEAGADEDEDESEGEGEVGDVSYESASEAEVGAVSTVEEEEEAEAAAAASAAPATVEPEQPQPQVSIASTEPAPEVAPPSNQAAAAPAPALPTHSSMAPTREPVGRVEKEVRQIELRAKDSMPPAPLPIGFGAGAGAGSTSPGKIARAYTPSASAGANHAESYSRSHSRPGSVVAASLPVEFGQKKGEGDVFVDAAPAPSSGPMSGHEEASDSAPTHELAIAPVPAPQPMRGLRPLKLMGRPASVLGPSSRVNVAPASSSTAAAVDTAAKPKAKATPGSPDNRLLADVEVPARTTTEGAAIPRKTAAASPRKPLSNPPRDPNTPAPARTPARRTKGRLTEYGPTPVRGAKVYADVDVDVDVDGDAGSDEEMDTDDGGLGEFVDLALASSPSKTPRSPPKRSRGSKGSKGSKTPRSSLPPHKAKAKISLGPGSVTVQAPRSRVSKGSKGSQASSTGWAWASKENLPLGMGMGLGNASQRSLGEGVQTPGRKKGSRPPIPPGAGAGAGLRA